MMSNILVRNLPKISIYRMLAVRLPSTISANICTNPIVERACLLPTAATCLHESRRWLAKNKDRKKEKKSDKPRVILDNEEMNQVLDYDEFQLQVDVLIDEMKNDLKLNYNISYDGIKVRLGDIVSIVRKQQDFMLNFAATPNAVKPAVNAINHSGLNLNPQQDGTMIYIRMPKVTTEHRQALIKSVRTVGQKVKDKMKDRNFQKKFFFKPDKKLSEDIVSGANENLAYYTKQKGVLVDEIVEKKIESLSTN